MEAGNVVVYRFATAFGLSPRLRLDLMINDFTFQALKNRQLIVFEKGFRRTFIHVRDMAKAFIHAVENYDLLKDQAYNVGHESMNYTKEEVAVAIQNKIDYHLNFNEIETIGSTEEVPVKESCPFDAAKNRIVVLHPG